MTTEQLERWKILGIPFNDAYVRLAQIGDKMKAEAETRKSVRKAAEEEAKNKAALEAIKLLESITHYHDTSGKKIGFAYGDKKQRAIVTNSTDIAKIKSNDKSKVATPLSEVQSAYILPSDAALQASIDVFIDTEAPTELDDVGGLHGESAMVFKDGIVERGPSGEKGYLDEVKNTYMTHEELPDLPSNYSENDIEVIIHSHATNVVRQQRKTDVDKFSWCGGNALVPSSKDEENPRWKRHTNIIVGPLGIFKEHKDPATGYTLYDKPTQANNGIVIYKEGKQEKKIENNILTIKVVNKILKFK